MVKKPRCPECGVALNPRNFRRHIVSVHPSSSGMRDSEIRRSEKRFPRPRPVQLYPSRTVLLVAGAVVVLSVLAGAYILSTPWGPANKPPYTPPPLVQTLDPSNFTGDTREAYEIAREIPGVLNWADCYCGCQNNALSHRSLLYCFKDMHGASCSICKSEASTCLDLYNQGYSNEQVRSKIKELYGK